MSEVDAEFAKETAFVERTTSAGVAFSAGGRGLYTSKSGITIASEETVGVGPASDASRTRMELYDWLQCIVFAIICGIFIFVFVGRTIGVEGDSMRDTLHWYDRVIMTNLFFTPKNGDIVVFRSPSDKFGGVPLVKRVIAVGGQTIDINFDTGDVIVDGVILDEPYIYERTTSRLDFSGPVDVPEGYIFVMGDNRNRSSDSRDAQVGLVDTRYVLGKVLFIAVPGGSDTDPRDWYRIGLVH
jgi:signal peptidase I